MLKRLVKIAAYNRDWPHYVLDKLRSEKPGDLLRFRLRNGQQVTLPYETRFLLNEIYLDRVYDSSIVNYADCQTVLDLGGNVGLYALYVSSRNPRAKIFSFEPASGNLALLRQNLQQNPANAAQIKVLPFAVGGQNGAVTLSLEGTPAEYALVDDAKSGARTEQVRCVDLAGVFELCNVDEFDLVKVDIEGAEAALFNAATDAELRRFKTLVLEWHYSWEELEALAARFRAVGFDAKPMLVDGHMRFLHARRG